eukprot:2005656-Amphidinium_carterae.2
MLSLRYPQYKKTKPNPRQSNSKGNLSAGPTMTFKDWSTEATNYLCLEEPTPEDAGNYSR